MPASIYHTCIPFYTIAYCQNGMTHTVARKWFDPSCLPKFMPMLAKLQISQFLHLIYYMHIVADLDPRLVLEIQLVLVTQLLCDHMVLIHMFCLLAIMLPCYRTLLLV